MSSPWKNADNCKICDTVFGYMSDRRHHCRACGESVCSEHSKKTMLVKEVSSTTQSKVCDNCFAARIAAAVPKPVPLPAAVVAPTPAAVSTPEPAPKPTTQAALSVPEPAPAPAPSPKLTPEAPAPGKDLYAIFIQRSKDVKAAKNPSNDQKLEMYSYYKYVKEGPCTTSRPGMFDPVARAKWDAYNKVRDISRDKVMQKYIDLVDDLLGNPRTNITIKRADKVFPAAAAPSSKPTPEAHAAVPASRTELDDTKEKVEQVIDMVDKVEKVAEVINTGTSVFSLASKLSHSTDIKHAGLIINNEKKDEEKQLKLMKE